MANTKILPVHAPEMSEALETARLSTQYECNAGELRIVVKDEEIRKLRVRILLLEDEVDHLHGQLVKEAEHVDGLQSELFTVNDQLVDMDANTQILSNDLRSKARELDLLKAELSSMSHISSDTAKILTEKLSLAREVASLKPEVESLRAQAAMQREVLAEKLALQRQLTTVQVELENAQRTIDRNAAKQAKNHDRTEFELQLDEAHAQLGEATKAQKLAEREVERLTGELEISRVNEGTRQNENAHPPIKASQNTEIVSNLKSEIADLRKQLRAETSLRQNLETEVQQIKTNKQSVDDIESQKAVQDSLQKELAQEKKNSKMNQKAHEKSQTAWEAEKSLLDDKLEAFRNKLRLTKEKLKQAEQQLKEMQNLAAKNEKDARTITKNARKRGAAQLDDTMLGTPGDGQQFKRNKIGAAHLMRASAVNTSSFSITPFLNRTMSLAPESPEPVVEEADADEPAVTIVASPSVDAKKDKAVRSKVLKPASAGKHNARKPTQSCVLEKVTEEPSMLEKAPTQIIEEAGDQEIVIATTTTKVPLTTEPTLKLKAKNPGAKSRKSLMSFASFVEEAAPEKKKKRKLGGGSAPKTLFDEDDEDKLPSKPIPGRGIFGVKSLAKPFLFGKTKALTPAAESFQQFSPLKKDRRR